MPERKDEGYRLLGRMVATENELRELTQEELDAVAGGTAWKTYIDDNSGPTEWDSVDC